MILWDSPNYGIRNTYKKIQIKLFECTINEWSVKLCLLMNAAVMVNMHPLILCPACAAVYQAVQICARILQLRESVFIRTAEQWGRGWGRGPQFGPALIGYVSRFDRVPRRHWRSPSQWREEVLLHAALPLGQTHGPQTQTRQSLHQQRPGGGARGVGGKGARGARAERQAGHSAEEQC